MSRGLLVAVAMLALTACTSTGDTAATGNMVDRTTVSTPKQPRWFGGQLVVEPAGRGNACLLLSTATGKYVLRSAAPRLVAIAWQADGAFDATRSGIAEGRRMVAAYADERISVRGGVVGAEDPVCPAYPTLGFVAARRGPAAEPTPSAGSSSPADAAEDEPELGGIPVADLEWKSGTLVTVPGNQGEGRCLALDTSVGAYALDSATNEYDVVVAESAEGGIDERRTGIHVHGRNSLGMARLVGQAVTLRGAVEPGTDFTCSRYPSFSIVDLR